MNDHIYSIESKTDFYGSSVNSIIRLLNFMIDTLVWLILFLSVAYVFDLYFVRFNSYIINYTYSIFLGIVIYMGYYSLLEYNFHRTLGKFLTRTKVVNVNGGAITFSTILIRTVSRLIPIDIFYYLFSKTGLHDRLSNTLVIKAKSSNSLN